MRILLVLAASVLLLAGFASSGTPGRAQEQVRITMTPEACRAAPVDLEPGDVVFAVTNQTLRPRTFTIAGRRTRYLPAGSTGLLRVTFTRTGVYRFFCVSQGSRARVRTGVVAVRPVPPPPPPPPPPPSTSGITL